ncbi:hypothetical protein ACHHYP_10119 [Achlya hypogyna]|uniref:Uncharacterized protein n=1 Tax=Achlya hypogyna TaxID=1202772 RepID=A0A1V9ZID0_ACHHY|nr:hypothetical protein ACHHYP_10119 [Achlya hypogyna]
MDMEMDPREESSLRGFLGGQFLHAIDTTHRPDDDDGYYGYARDRVESYHTTDRSDDKIAWMYKTEPTRIQRSSSYPTEASFAYRKEPVAYTPTASRNSHPNISPTGGMSPFRGHDEVANGIMNSTSIPEVGNNDTQKHLRSKNLPSSILFNSGRWSIEEHNRFVQGLGAFPHGVLNRWRKISKAVGTRTVLQTRTHAQKFFRKLQKQDEVKSLPDDENYLANGPDESLAGSKPKPKVPFTGGLSQTKDESYTAPRTSDPGSYEPRGLTPLSTITDHMPRQYSSATSSSLSSQSQQQSHHGASPPNNAFPSNLFPSISIPPTSNAHLASSIATPTTESSRAFSNMSLGPRASPAPSTYPAARGNDQWVDWLLSNIDTIVTKNGRPTPGGGDEGRPHAKSDAGFMRSGRGFRSASESHVQYRPHDADTQHWDAVYPASYPSSSTPHGASHSNDHYYAPDGRHDGDEHDEHDGSQHSQTAFYDGGKYALPTE